MSESEPANGQQFNELIANLALSCHGSAELRAIKEFLARSLKKTSQREEFLLPRILQDVITWETVKDRVWEESTVQQENKFHFLQGDIIGTTTVLALGMAESTQEHDLWMVLSPDCDCVRSSYVRVAPVFAVSYNTQETNYIQRFGHALKLASPKAFPLPLLPGDDKSVLRGYFADLDAPYYIADQDKTLATPYASMTISGWHLLNGLIQEKETRAANITEATAIRIGKMCSVTLS